MVKRKASHQDTRHKSGTDPLLKKGLNPQADKKGTNKHTKPAKEDKMTTLSFTELIKRAKRKITGKKSIYED